MSDEHDLFKALQACAVNRSAPDWELIDGMSKAAQMDAELSDTSSVSGVSDTLMLYLGRIGTFGLSTEKERADVQVIVSTWRDRLVAKMSPRHQTTLPRRIILATNSIASEAGPLPLRERHDLP